MKNPANKVTAITMSATMSQTNAMIVHLLRATSRLTYQNWIVMAGIRTQHQNILFSRRRIKNDLHRSKNYELNDKELEVVNGGFMLVGEKYERPVTAGCTITSGTKKKNSNADTMIV